MAGLHRGAFPQSQVPLIDRGSAYTIKIDIDRVTLKLNLSKSAILLSAHITKKFFIMCALNTIADLLNFNIKVTLSM